MKVTHLLGMGAIALSAVACTTNPITGRSSLQLANNSEILTMSSQEYKTTLSKGKVITGTADAKRVVNVGNRIKSAAERYYQSIGRSADLASYSWEFNLLQSSELNAWCMPGGKVAVYTGILPVTKDDNGLAVVMGHEVSHALAGHGNERISQAMVAQYGGAILGGTISNSQWASVFQKVIAKILGTIMSQIPEWRPAVKSTPPILHGFCAGKFTWLYCVRACMAFVRPSLHGPIAPRRVVCGNFKRL